MGLALLLATACSDDPAPPTSVGGTDTTTGGGTGGSTGEVNIPVTPDLGFDIDKPPADADDSPKEGPDCETNDDCESFLCVATANGNKCTSPCITECPVGYECTLMSGQGADLQTVCLPKDLSLCFPCDVDTDCTQIAGALQTYEGAKCVPYGDLGSYCGAACEIDDDCLEGFECGLINLKEGSVRQCVPSSGQCHCSSLAEELGLSTSCQNENETGTCDGARKCVGGEISECDAPFASEEKCDGKDNNCNSQTDEGLSAQFADKQLGVCKGSSKICDGTNGWAEPDYTALDGYSEDESKCDTLDNDCDGQTDETFTAGSGIQFEDFDGELKDMGAECGAGECVGGVVTCAADGVSLTCSTLAESSQDFCDGLDNDCDPTTPDGADDPGVGVVCDSDDGDLCKNGVTACVTGLVTCVEEETGGTLEVCDQIDNDCNPATPDGFADPAVNMGCDGDDADLCKEGLNLCVAGQLICTDSNDVDPETCDGVDNDCNPETPDGSGDPKLGKECDGEDPDLCKEGFWVCDGIELTCDDENDLDLELCDGEDNDCNAATPDGSGDSQIGKACDGIDFDLCKEGVWSCEVSGLTCGDPNVENNDICDGQDNDCNPQTPDGSQVFSTWAPSCLDAPTTKAQSVALGQNVNLSGGFNRIAPVDYIHVTFEERAIGLATNRSISLSGGGYVMSVISSCDGEAAVTPCDGALENAGDATGWTTSYSYDANGTSDPYTDPVPRPTTVTVKIWRKAVSVLCEGWQLNIQNN